MEIKESLRCYILQKFVYLIRTVNMDLRNNMVITRTEKKCSEAHLCCKTNVLCKWVSSDYCYDGMDRKNLPPFIDDPRNN